METIHYGLNCAQLKTLEKYRTKTNIEIMIMWARNMIRSWNVQIGDPNYQVLEKAPHFFGVNRPAEIEEYIRTIIAEITEAGPPVEPTS